MEVGWEDESDAGSHDTLPAAAAGGLDRCCMLQPRGSPLSGGVVLSYRYVSYQTDTRVQVNDRKIVWLGPLPPASRQILPSLSLARHSVSVTQPDELAAWPVKVKFSPALLLISSVPLAVRQYPFICSNVWVRPLFWDKQFVQSHWHLRTGIPRPFSAI